MLRNAVFTIFTAVWIESIFAQELLFCGEARYSPASYVCYDDEFLCPILYGVPTLRCGPACYSRNIYNCNNGQLELLPIAPDGFTVEAGNPQAPFYQKEFQGCNNRIVLGLDRPCTFCPSLIPDCPPGDKTIFLDGFDLFARVPGGNLLYIKPNGEIKYTQGKSGGISSVDLVGITAYENGAYTYGGAAWRACPIEGSDPPQWQVFAELPGLSFNSSCIPFEGLVKNDTSGKAGAWAYT